MRRWHTQREQLIMSRRWRYEFEVNHSGDAHTECACVRGTGYYRKRTPNGHHHTCEECHPSFTREDRDVIARALADECAPRHRSRKNTARWCRGKPGREHLYIWRASRESWLKGRMEACCTRCGKIGETWSSSRWRLNRTPCPREGDRYVA